MKGRILLLAGAAVVTASIIATAQVPGVNSPWNPVFAIPVDNQKNSYVAAVAAVTPGAAATDVFTLCGSATKTLRVTQLAISGTASPSAAATFAVVRRSTANAGGTSTTVTPIALDSSYATATGTLKAYTASPTTLGTLTGALIQRSMFVPATSTAALGNAPMVMTFGSARPVTAAVLRGTGQCLAVNLASTTLTGGSLNFDVEWAEE